MADDTDREVQRLQEFDRRLKREVRQLFQQEADRLYPEIIAKTPLKTGRLEKSVYTKVTTKGSVVTLTAGASVKGVPYDYARIQHDSPHFHHPIKGQAYYVRNPFEACVVRLQEKLSRRIK